MNRKEILLLSLITFLTVVAWIIFGIAHAQRSSSISPSQLREVVPLTPTFDNDILKRLKSREE